LYTVVSKVVTVFIFGHFLNVRSAREIFWS
jgi:hypothetical protein